MAENKTKPTKVSPAAFIASVQNEQKRKDARELVAVMRELTGHPPKMWGPSIIGFGQYHYRYPSGREGDIPLAGFSPRKPSLVVYIGESLANTSLMAKLGKYKVGKGCLYINKLDDVDRALLRELIATSIATLREKGLPGRTG